MNDNDESDSYKNNGLHGSLDYKLNDNLIKYIKTRAVDFQYDAVASAQQCK